MRRIAGVLLSCLLLVAAAAGQDVPLEIKGDTVTVVKTLPFNVAAPEGYHLYHWSLPAGVNGIDKGSVMQVMTAPKGSLTIGVKLTKIDFEAKKLDSKFGSITFSVGDLVPVPPTPKPDDPPQPKPNPDVKPAPIAVPGLRVAILYETADLTKYPLEQRSIPQSKAVRDFLDTKCAMEPDGKTRAYYIGDVDVDMSRYFPGWKEALARPRTSLPWLIISNYPKGGVEQPLPTTVQETLNLLKKYAELP